MGNLSLCEYCWTFISLLQCEYIVRVVPLDLRVSLIFVHICEQLFKLSCKLFYCIYNENLR